MLIKPSIPNEVTDFSEVLAKFSSGDLHVGYGGISKTDADLAFSDRTNMESLLSSKTVKIADLAEKPGKTESKVEALKTSNYTMEGKRTNTIELSLVGVNTSRKQWIEEELNKQNVTFILLNKERTAALIFNDRRWTGNWAYEIEGFFTATLSTEFSGPTSSAFMIYKDIPAE